MSLAIILYKSTHTNPPLFSIVYLINRYHVAVYLFSNRSYVMSEYGKNKKVAHEMQLSLFQFSVIKMEQNSKWHDSSRVVKKQGRLQHC